MSREADAIKAISITLSPNDAGETGGHQAGPLVPKTGDILKFFPDLPEGVKNPRKALRFRDDSGEGWEFMFIYYNNKKFGGTRDEYRLTRMTKYMRKYGLKSGDEIILSRDTAGNHRVSHKTGRRAAKEGRMRLGDRWRVVRI